MDYRYVIVFYMKTEIIVQESVKIMNREVSRKIKQNSRLIGMILLCVLFWVLAAFFRGIYAKQGYGFYLTAAITFLTFAYHFSMRILVGIFITALFWNREFPMYSKLLLPTANEQHLYKKWKVKTWKQYAITANPGQFDVQSLNLKELLHNMIQAEMVHECIIILSFVPLLFSIPFGAMPVFFITSVMAACIDLKYVIIQRYNIPRVIKLIERKEKT